MVGWGFSPGRRCLRYSPRGFVADAALEVVEYNLVLQEFEGPLDLLLHLVKKHELDVFHIPISFITGKYMQALLYMQAVNMDLAGEYLLMAATLAYLKSRELLPPEAQVEDPEVPAEEVGDPRESLIRRLLEYQKFKSAGEYLAQRPVMGRNVWARGARGLDVASAEFPLDAPLAEIPVWELIGHLAQVLGRTRRKLSHEVTIDRLSLADRINELNERLDRLARLEFTQMLREFGTREDVGPFGGQVVLTFMAVLEMARLKLLKVYQADEMGEIYLSRAAGSGLGGVGGQRQVELPFVNQPSVSAAAAQGAQSQASDGSTEMAVTDSAATPEPTSTEASPEAELQSVPAITREDLQ